ncbi:PilZ domain-containing protein [Pseudobacteriovorax antillogorgiicola]|uniref:PilZ domain-containing protein n=1 Tax=Pseudobacteriovorax antillogorgiicola TaxID=1513793 RepID=A0A1Y6BT51_9BACT|nr:PilZ domain-containing protein [Pseudobacteriovorax antillogorgiicola]TCS53955.1 PilZ domain-containing protein [Pseudobacteriovorax antillogorgiicola]SMF20070.1 PilZ domain-containing protein [Pseudobacteriovorax antillogorgiicola]
MSRYFSKQRKERRYRVQRFGLQAKASPLASIDQLSVEIFDLSFSGLGILAAQPLKVTEFRIVSLDAPHMIAVPCRVAWCFEVPETGQFRAGLKVADPDEDSLKDLLNRLLESVQED